MSDAWEDIDMRTRARLEAEGVRDLPALRAWLAQHPEGSDKFGRVMLTELRGLLKDSSS